MRATRLWVVSALMGGAVVAQQVSNTGRCGSKNRGLVCTGSSYGNCCSGYGYCGSTSDYCGTNCDPAYGSCTGQGNEAVKKASTDGSCGGPKGFTCVNSKFGNCCSQYGYCGQTTAYCGTGCNTAFGTCNNAQSSSIRSTSTRASSTLLTSTRSSSAGVVPSPSSAIKVSTDARCGPSFGATCAGSTFGDCCSQYSYCGSTNFYCGTGCQQGFGKCGSSTPGTTRSTTSSSVVPTVIPSSAVSSSTLSSPSSVSSTITSSSIESSTSSLVQSSSAGLSSSNVLSSTVQSSSMVESSTTTSSSSLESTSSVETTISSSSATSATPETSSTSIVTSSSSVASSASDVSPSSTVVSSTSVIISISDTPTSSPSTLSTSSSVDLSTDVATSTPTSLPSLTSTSSTIASSSSSPTPSCVPYSANYVSNPGFETGDATGFTLSPGSGVSVSYPSPGLTGSYLARFATSNTAVNAIIHRQDGIKIADGTTVSVYVSVRSLNAAQPGVKSFRIYFDNTLVGTIFPTNNEWTRIGMPAVVAKGDTHFVYLRSYRDSTVGDFGEADDFSISAVSPPVGAQFCT